MSASSRWSRRRRAGPSGTGCSPCGSSCARPKACCHRGPSPARITGAASRHCRRGSRASRSPRRSSAPSSPRATTSSPARRRPPPWCCRSWSRPPERCWAPRRGTPWPLPCGPPAYIYKTTMTTRRFSKRPAPAAPSPSPAAESLVARVDQQRPGETPGDTIPTGFPSIDRMLGGGLRRRDLVVLGGDIGAGKSALALGLALRVAQQGAGAARPTQDEDLALALQRLKALALERQVAALVVSQLPRFDAKRPNPRPSLDDFGHLGAIKQHADLALGIYREEMYNPGYGVEGATELIVLKNRNGPTGFVDLYFYRRWMRFEDMLDPDR